MKPHSLIVRCSLCSLLCLPSLPLWAANDFLPWNGDNWNGAKWAYPAPDHDNDSVVNANDAFPLDSSESLDTDTDYIGNNQDWDDDGDSVVDVVDAEPLNAAATTEINLPLDAPYRGRKIESAVSH